MGTKLASIKRLLCIVLIICNIVILSGCMGNDEKSFDSINKRFLQDFSAIDAAVNSEQYDDATSLSWIKSVDENDGYVDFYCGGSGMGSQTNYTGFFFTPDDDPLAMWRKNDPILYVMSAADFVKTADGWEYRESDHDSRGDNVFIVRRLAPCYYYYYLHF